jgi:hypothetical protein
MAYLVLNVGSLQAMFGLAGRGWFVDSWAYHAGLHLSLGALVWGLLYGLFVLYHSRRRDSEARLVRARGSVLLETAIIMPVALLLIMGLCQLIVINLAGALANVAVFEATRAAWIWESERIPASAERMGENISKSDVSEFARVQAASVMTPVAPGIFNQDKDFPESQTDRAERARAMFYTAQDLNIPDNPGGVGRARQAVGRVTDQAAVGNRATGSGLSVVQALDPSAFKGRSARKFTAAYHAVDATYEERDEKVGIVLDYYQLCAFPLVGSIFGERQTRGERTGFYRRIHRTMFRVDQLDAHKKWPSASPDSSTVGSMPETPLGDKKDTRFNLRPIDSVE